MGLGLTSTLYELSTSISVCLYYWVSHTSLMGGGLSICPHLHPGLSLEINGGEVGHQGVRLGGCCMFMT